MSLCMENSHIPSDMDEAFVLNYDINFEDEESGFRYFVTTLRLLEILKRSYVSMTDATYKLTWGELGYTPPKKNNF